jgi:hypothetical protein
MTRRAWHHQHREAPPTRGHRAGGLTYRRRLRTLSASTNTASTVTGTVSAVMMTCIIVTTSLLPRVPGPWALTSLRVPAPMGVGVGPHRPTEDETASGATHYAERPVIPATP